MAEIENTAHFIERYALYAALLIVGFSVTSTNIFARTIRPDEIGQGAIWTTFVQDQIPELIVDSTPAGRLSGEPTLAVGGHGTSVVAIPAVYRAPEIATAIGEAKLAASDMGGAPIARDEVVQYVVEGGDTVSTIAQQFNVSSRTVLWANGLSESDYIRPGQSLKIPPQSGYLYRVAKGDTLARIAQKYKGNVDKILEANRMASAAQIKPGDEIIIPGGEPPAPPAPPTRTLGGIFRNTVASNPPPSGPVGAGRFAWPTPNHRINQYYRGRIHTGVDIEGTYSSPIYAAAGGLVTFSGWDRSGYGLHVVVEHGNGYRTLYGHASKVFVRVGQRVSRGQTIAMVGSTGRSTGTHLHFEIRTSAGFFNPLAFY